MLDEQNKFTNNYEILKEISENLRIQREANIDELVPMLEKATKAYSICKERLEAVKFALAQYIPENLSNENP